MDIIVRVTRDVVVDNNLDLGDIETSGSDVGCDQNARGGGTEPAEVVDALALGQLRVQRGDAVVEQPQQMMQEIGGAGAVAEDDDGLVNVLRREQEHVQVVLAVGDGHLEVHLSQSCGDGEALGVDFADEDGGAAGDGRALGEGLDFGRHGGGEEKGLALGRRRQHGEALFDVGQHGALAAVGEQAVGFVEYDELDAAKAADGVFAGSADVVGETAGGGDDEMGPVGEVDGLFAHVGAAGDEDGFENVGLREGDYLFHDLQGKFAVTSC